MTGMTKTGMKKAAYHPDFTPIELWTKTAYNKESVKVKLVYYKWTHSA
jgi:hypothetical protein